MQKNLAQYLTVISQIGIVVEDLKAAVDRMRLVYQAEPDWQAETPETERYYFGKPGNFRCRMAFYTFANVDLELMEPLEGESMWKDFLRTGRRGLHHIRYDVEDLDTVIAAFQAEGVAVGMSGLAAGRNAGRRWACMDTERQLGYVIELFECA